MSKADLSRLISCYLNGIGLSLIGTGIIFALLDVVFHSYSMIPVAQTAVAVGTGIWGAPNLTHLIFKETRPTKTDTARTE